MKNPDQDFLCHFEFNRFKEPRCYISASASQSSSQTHTTTGTTSGASSPVAAEDSQALGTGSIGVGSGQYLEEGAENNAGANLSTNSTTTVSAGANSTVVTGDPDADAVIESLANDFSGVAGAISSNAAGSSGGGTTTYLPSAPMAVPSSISYTTLGVWATIIACVIGLLAYLSRKGKL